MFSWCIYKKRKPSPVPVNCWVVMVREANALPIESLWIIMKFVNWNEEFNDFNNPSGFNHIISCIQCHLEVRFSIMYILWFSLSFLAFYRMLIGITYGAGFNTVGNTHTHILYSYILLYWYVTVLATSFRNRHTNNYINIILLVRYFLLGS